MKYTRTYTVYPKIEWKFPLILKKEEAELTEATNLRCADEDGNPLEFIDRLDYLFINAPDLEAGKPYKVVITYERTK
jgi:hypothetical protein